MKKNKDENMEFESLSLEKIHILKNPYTRSRFKDVSRD